MFTQEELELLAEALNYRINNGDFNQKDGKFETAKHKADLNHLADKVVSFQENSDDECASDI